jgi:hypothetical protein
MTIKQSLQQLVEQVFGTSGAGRGGSGGPARGAAEGGAFSHLKKYDAQKQQRNGAGQRRISHDPTNNADDALFRVFDPPLCSNHPMTPTLLAARGGQSPITPHGGGGASTSAALISLPMVNTQPNPLPLPACLVELEERERDLVILRPGELLLPPSDPPLWMSGGRGVDEADGIQQITATKAAPTPCRGRTFLERLVKMLMKDEQSTGHLRGALSLETHQPFWRKSGSAATQRVTNDTGAYTRRVTKAPPSQADALRRLGDGKHAQHSFLTTMGGGDHAARPPTAPKAPAHLQSSRRPHHANVQHYHMMAGPRDWARRWSADTGGGRSHLNDGSSPVSPTGMPESFAWTPGASPGTAALNGPSKQPHHYHPNGDPLRYYSDLPALGEDEYDGGFAPWGGGGGGGVGGGSNEGDGSLWRSSRPGTGSYHAAALKEAKLRLAPRPRGELGDHRWSPTKPFR